MSENKIDITSTAIEKGIDLVKGFLDKLIGAPIEEYGLIFADNVRLRRFRNQIKIVSKAQKIIEQSNINIKQISIKTLVPLLEYSSLEDDESIQDKWSNMIVNFADVNETYESSIFPFILSQVSRNEIEIIFKMYNDFQHDSFSRYKAVGIERDNLIRLGLVDSTIPTKFKQMIFLPFVRLTDNVIINDLGLQFVKVCSSRNNI